MKIIRVSFILFFLLAIFLQKIYLSCESPTKVKSSFVINDEKKSLILMVLKEVVNWTKEYISFGLVISSKQYKNQEIFHQVYWIEYQGHMEFIIVRW